MHPDQNPANESHLQRAGGARPITSRDPEPHARAGAARELARGTARVGTTSHGCSTAAAA